MLSRQPAYMDDGGCLWLQFVMHQWRRPTERRTRSRRWWWQPEVPDGGALEQSGMESDQPRRLGVVESCSVTGGGSADWTRRLICSTKRDEGHVCSYICRHVRPSLSPWRARAQLEAATVRVNLELDLHIGKEANWLQQGSMLQLDTSEHPSWLGCWHHQIEINKWMGRKR
jgi:hypothetical protein